MSPFTSAAGKPYSNVIAFVWDFDGTLARGYMQTPLFAKYGIDEATFWRESNLVSELRRAMGHDVTPEITYLERMLTYVHEVDPTTGVAPMAGLSNVTLRELGAEIEFFDGVEECLTSLKRLPETDPALAGFAVEHYVVSTGLKEMILGSRIAPLITKVYAAEFGEGIFPPGFSRAHAEDARSVMSGTGVVQRVATAMTHAGKAETLFKISKGLHLAESFDVNDRMPEQFRHVPFEQMFYIADGPSDINAFALLGEKGGTRYGVYDPREVRKMTDARALRAAERVDAIFRADYTRGSDLWNELHSSAVEKAHQVLGRLVDERQKGTHRAVTHRDAGKPGPAWFLRPPQATQKLSDSYLKEHPERGQAESPIETAPTPERPVSI